VQERGKESAPNRVEDGDINMINEISSNNGITKLASSKNIIKGNSITISVNYAQNVFYQKDDFCASVNILVLRSTWLNNNNIGLFISSLLSKNNIQYNYSTKISKDKLNDTKIQLPIKNGKIDFDFMESFIAELELQKMLELNEYLETQGLKDYHLTQTEKQVLADFEDGKFKWGEFRIGDLFEVNSSNKRFDANKVEISESGRPYVVRTALNNGIRGYINEDEQFLNEGNTISFGQDTATMFYQENPYFTGDKIKIVKPKTNKFNKTIAQFFITAMTKSFTSFAWGSSSFNIKIINNQLLTLPIKNDCPDYELMETLIRAIQKLVIKGVVEYVEGKMSIKE